MDEALRHSTHRNQKHWKVLRLSRFSWKQKPLPGTPAPQSRFGILLHARLPHEECYSMCATALQESITSWDFWHSVLHSESTVLGQTHKGLICLCKVDKFTVYRSQTSQMHLKCTWPEGHRQGKPPPAKSGWHSPDNSQGCQASTPRPLLNAKS